MQPYEYETIEEYIKRGGKLRRIQNADGTPVASTSDTTPKPPKSLRDKFGEFSTGFVKGAAQTAIGTARVAQGLGQRTMAAMDPTRSLDQVRKTTGFKSLQGKPAEEIDEQLKSESGYETAGKVAEFGAEIINPLGRAEDVANLAGKAAGVIKRGVNAGVNDVKGFVGGTEGTSAFMRKAFKGRTKEEIAKIPENLVHRLSPDERQMYFNIQREAVESRVKKLDETVQKVLKSDTERTFTEASRLQKELSTASREEVLRLRPKILQGLSKQSAQYRRLVGEQLAGKGDLDVDESVLSQFVDTRFGDPGIAQSIKAKLGLTGEGKITNLKELYERTKELRSGLPSAAKKGTRSYTGEEKLTDDAVSTLVDFLRDNGVDLKAANQFWAKYAPIRDQLIREAKPFTQAGTNTKTFANTITRVLKGDDVHNENFIKAVEDLVGQPIGDDIKKVLAQLDDNQKRAMTQKALSEARMAEHALLKERALGKIDDAVFETRRQAKMRDLVRDWGFWALALPVGGAGLFGLGKAVKAATD